MHSFPQLILLALLSSFSLAAFVQQPSAPTTQNPEADPAASAATTTKLTMLRNAFVQEAKSVGSSCSLDSPRIEITDVPSFGNYDPASNTLRISAWSLLKADQKKFFFHLAGPDADDEAAHRVFDRGTYSWVIVHELGHWWQACNASTQNNSHYQHEYDANRIAAAYWREHNPTLLQELITGFTHILNGAPNPVPPGQTLEDYFNVNYEALAHSAHYVWFQARMVTDVSAEDPPPTFADALLHSSTKMK